MPTLIAVQDAIIQHIANDRHPQYCGASFGHMRDWYRATIGILDHRWAQAAKIALTFIISLCAAPVMFRGYLGLTDRGYNRFASLAYLYGGLVVLAGWWTLMVWGGRG